METTNNLRILRQRLHQQIVDHPRMLELMHLSTTDKTHTIKQWIKETLSQSHHQLNEGDLQYLLTHLENEILGLGPLEALMQDEDITDILVNGPNHVYIEKEGLLRYTDIQFDNDEHLKHTIDKIISPIGRRLDEMHPMVDARLQDGSRLNAILPPLALQGPILSIRRFRHHQNQQLGNLVERHMLSSPMAELCQHYVSQQANILISGGTGSGKTTFLNALASHISEQERLITIEDTAELHIKHPHIVTLETREANLEGGGEITGQQLLKNALRMRPNRILFGEIRAQEAQDLIQAMNTGHPGSMATIHANSPEHAILRLQQLIETYHPNSTQRDLYKQLLQTIDIIVHVGRDKQGQRRVMQLCEIHPKRHHALVGMFQFKENQFVSINQISKFKPQAQRLFL